MWGVKSQFKRHERNVGIVTVPKEPLKDCTFY